MSLGSSVPNNGQETVVITGAGGGLGRAIARRLMADGFRCVLADRNELALQETESLTSSDPTRVATVVCDIRDADDRRALINHAAGEPGTLFGLVNNAGLARAEPFLDESLGSCRDILETNLEAAYFLSQRAIEHMRPHRCGRIVNIASVYGVMAFDNRGYGTRAPETSEGDRGPFRQTAYDTSKAGLIQVTKDLAAAAGRWGINVNSISPGTIPHPETYANAKRGAANSTESPGATVPKAPGLGDRVDPDILRALADQVPLKRLGTVDEIAGPVSFLLSNDASCIAGANLVVDGGWTVW